MPLKGIREVLLGCLLFFCQDPPLFFWINLKIPPNASNFKNYLHQDMWPQFCDSRGSICFNLFQWCMKWESVNKLLDDACNSFLCTHFVAWFILSRYLIQYNTFERERRRARRFNSRCCCSAQAAMAISPRWSKAFRFFISHSIHAWDAWQTSDNHMP